MSATHGPDRIRELNSLAILDYLRSVDEATVSQIAQETGLSRTSVGATFPVRGRGGRRSGHRREPH